MVVKWCIVPRFPALPKRKISLPTLSVTDKAIPLLARYFYLVLFLSFCFPRMNGKRTVLHCVSEHSILELPVTVSQSPLDYMSRTRL